MRMRLIGAALVATLGGLNSGCVDNHFRFVERNGTEWAGEAASYPRVVRLTTKTFPSGETEGVDVYYSPTKDLRIRKFAEIGSIENAPRGAHPVAELAILRASSDHEGALRELRRMAAELGANALVDVRYTVIVGERWLGGAELVAWVYEGKAVRNEEAGQ